MEITGLNIRADAVQEAEEADRPLVPGEEEVLSALRSMRAGHSIAAVDLLHAGASKFYQYSRGEHLYPWK